MVWRLLVRNHCPSLSDRVAKTNIPIVINGDISAMAFTGIGQYFIVAVEHDDQSKWFRREADQSCKPLQETRFVIDNSAQDKCEVRPGFSRYGAAAFFSSSRELISIWIEEDLKMSRKS